MIDYIRGSRGDLQQIISIIKLHETQKKKIAILKR